MAKTTCDAASETDQMPSAVDFNNWVEFSMAVAPAGLYFAATRQKMLITVRKHGCMGWCDRWHPRRIRRTVDLRLKRQTIVY